MGRFYELSIFKLSLELNSTVIRGHEERFGPVTKLVVQMLELSARDRITTVVTDFDQARAKMHVVKRSILAPPLTVDRQ